jgi:hypothetical protein
VRADAPELAVDMYTRCNQWEAAHKLASSYMSEGEVRMLYIDQVSQSKKTQREREETHACETETLSEAQMLCRISALALATVVTMSRAVWSDLHEAEHEQSMGYRMMAVKTLHTKRDAWL